METYLNAWKMYFMMKPSFLSNTLKQSIYSLKSKLLLWCPRSNALPVCIKMKFVVVSNQGESIVLPSHTPWGTPWRVRLDISSHTTSWWNNPALDPLEATWLVKLKACQMNSLPGETLSSLLQKYCSYTKCILLFYTPCMHINIVCCVFYEYLYSRINWKLN